MDVGALLDLSIILSRGEHEMCSIALIQYGPAMHSCYVVCHMDRKRGRCLLMFCILFVFASSDARSWIENQTEAVYPARETCSFRVCGR